MREYNKPDVKGPERARNVLKRVLDEHYKLYCKTVAYYYNLGISDKIGCALLPELDDETIYQKYRLSLSN